MSLKISIRNDYSRTPGPRYTHEGSYSGQEFRENFLYPKLLDALMSKDKVEVVLDGTSGYGTSFLEEAFGGLVRELEPKYGANDAIKMVESNIIIISKEEEYLVDDIKSYIRKALSYEPV